MKTTGASITHCKLRGEWAELRFMARASENGLRINKPWGESSRYDFAVEHAGKFFRVQVKSTTYRRGRSYICNLSASDNGFYTRDDIDFVAAYIIPKNIWYIFPMSALSKLCRSIILSPHMKISKHGHYQEAWHLLCAEKVADPSVSTESLKIRTEDASTTLNCARENSNPST